MLYTWKPSSHELIWSSYVNTITLCIESNSEPSIDSFKSLLDSKLKDIQDSLALSQYEMVSDNSSSIAYSNEQLHANNFFNRVLNYFPDGWLLEVTTG